MPPLTVPGIALLRGYPRAWLRPDLIAALSLWAMVVPQALAYAQLAGMPPATGLYTALAAMVGYALFGGNRYLNMGPESSVAIVVASLLGPLAVGDPARYAALGGQLALLVAAMLLAGYLLRLGVIMRLFSAPVLTGYLAGSAVIIISSQLSKVTASWWAAGIAAVAAVLVVVLGRTKLPAALIVLALATIVVAIAGLDSRVAIVGEVTGGLPLPRLPDGFEPALLGPAASIALLIYAGSVLTARSLAAQDGEDADPQQEFLGYAASNALAGLFGGFPANSSGSRSFLLAASGSRSQVTGLVAAAGVLVTVVALTPLVQDMPQAALAAVVVVTALRLFDVKEFARLWRTRRSDFFLAAVTGVGVLAFGVLQGIVVGVLASLLEVMRRAVLPHTAVLGGIGGTYRSVRNFNEAEVLPGLVVYRFDAPIFFANADVLRNDLRTLVEQADPPVRWIVLNAEAVYDLDTTGASTMERVLDDLDRDGITLTLARVRTPVRDFLREVGLEERIGIGNFYYRVADAVAAYEAAHPDAVPVTPARKRQRPGLLEKIMNLFSGGRT